MKKKINANVLTVPVWHQYHLALITGREKNCQLPKDSTIVIKD